LEDRATTDQYSGDKAAKVQASDQVKQTVKSNAVENATVDRVADMGRTSMIKGDGHALEAIHNTNAGGWSVVHRQSASPNIWNAPVHTSKLNTSKKVTTSNSFGDLVSEPIMDDTGRRMQQLEREAIPKTSHPKTKHSIKQKQKSEVSATTVSGLKDIVLVDDPKAVEVTEAFAAEEDEVIKDKSQDLREKINEITVRQEEQAFDQMLPRIRTWADRAEYEEEEGWDNELPEESTDLADQENGQHTISNFAGNQNATTAAIAGEQQQREHSTTITKSWQQQVVYVNDPSAQQQLQKIAAVDLESFKHSGDTSNKALFSDHDRALLDALDSPKPHKSSFSSGSKMTAQMQKFSVAKRHEPCSTRRLKRHEPLWMVIQEEASQKLEANLRVAISDEAKEGELIESCPEEATTNRDLSTKRSEKKK
ncbi:hypothetical protein A4A49_58590, partial [Nicotiana attenuata]